MPQLPRLVHRALATERLAGIEARLDALLQEERRRTRAIRLLAGLLAAWAILQLYLLLRD